MPTFKVVVIGASGVGKTSLRGQYISARFSSSYRATIGADFITKTLPSHAPDAEPVTLQIWDTAGQERFSSLASAFFRGADAAILMYDITAPETLEALTKWWAEFRDKAPVADEDLPGFCVAVVGNKVDLLEEMETGALAGVVSAAHGARFVRALIPRPDTPPPAPPLALRNDDDAEEAEYDDDLLASSQLTARPNTHSPQSPTSILRPNGTGGHHPRTSASASQISFSPLAIPGTTSASRASSRARSTLGRASLSTATSTLTVYHTPSSSVFSDSSASEYWHDAQSLHSHSHSYSSTSKLDDSLLSADDGGSPVRANGHVEQRPNRSPSEVTITPARFSNSNAKSNDSSSSPIVPESESGSDWGPSASAPPSPSKDKSKQEPKPNGKPLPRIDTAAPHAHYPFVSSSAKGKGKENGPTDAPSSAALSPLPYPQHLPPPSSFQSLLDSASHQWLAEPDTDAAGASGAAHFRTSARSGEGVGDVFGWVARRLVQRRRAEEEEERRRMGVDDRGGGGGASGHGGRRGGGGSAEERLRVRLGLNFGVGEGGANGGRCC